MGLSSIAMTFTLCLFLGLRVWIAQFGWRSSGLGCPVGATDLVPDEQIGRAVPGTGVPGSRQSSFVRSDAAVRFWVSSDRSHLPRRTDRPIGPSVDRTMA